MAQDLKDGADAGFDAGFEATRRRSNQRRARGRVQRELDVTVDGILKIAAEMRKRHLLMVDDDDPQEFYSAFVDLVTDIHVHIDDVENYRRSLVEVDAFFEKPESDDGDGVTS